MKTQKGFTLIEAMIVLVIMAILAAVAIPAFQQKKLKDECDNGSTYSCNQLNHRARNYGQQNVQTNSVGCVAGYKVLPNGNQLLNEHGGGISCNQ